MRKLEDVARQSYSSNTELGRLPEPHRIINDANTNTTEPHAS